MRSWISRSFENARVFQFIVALINKQLQNFWKSLAALEDDVLDVRSVYDVPYGEAP